LLTNNEAGIRNVFGQISEQNVTSDVQKLLAKESNPDIKTLLQEILNKPEDLRYSRVQRTLQRIDCIKTMCGGNFTRDKYKNAKPGEWHGCFGKILNDNWQMNY
jgi:hypothetical protein